MVSEEYFMNLHKMVEVKAIDLERFIFAARQMCPSQYLQYFGSEPEVALLEAIDYPDMLMVKVRQAVYGRTIEEVSIKVPQNWWEAVKERWLPSWAKKRWPIQYTVKTMRAREYYPTLVGYKNTAILKITCLVDDQEVDARGFVNA